MTSSPIRLPQQYLLGLLPGPDRGRNAVAAPLAGLLAAGIAAVIAGSRSFAAIGQWAPMPARRCWTGWARSAAAEE